MIMLLYYVLATGPIEVHKFDGSEYMIIPSYPFTDFLPLALLGSFVVGPPIIYVIIRLSIMFSPTRDHGYDSSEGGGERL